MTGEQQGTCRRQVVALEGLDELEHAGVLGDDVAQAFLRQRVQRVERGRVDAE